LLVTKDKPAIKSVRTALEVRASAAYLNISRLAGIVFGVLTLAVRRVLTAAVVTRVPLGTGDKRVTTRVVQGVKVAFVI